MRTAAPTSTIYSLPAQDIQTIADAASAVAKDQTSTAPVVAPTPLTPNEQTKRYIYIGLAIAGALVIIGLVWHFSKPKTKK